jgi:hypothetical protein
LNRSKSLSNSNSCKSSQRRSQLSCPSLIKRLKITLLKVQTHLLKGVTLCLSNL